MVGGTDTKFSLATIAYVFALLAAGMAAFGAGGILLAAGVLVYWWLVSERTFLFGVLLTAWLVFVAFLLSGLVIGDARGPTVRNSCLNNLKQIGLALNNYESAHGSFPPAFIAGPDGKPMHSWRVLILPYMEHPKLYEAYDFDEPWDGPNNRKLWDQMPEVYACPSERLARNVGVALSDLPPRHAASYVAVIGDSTLWTGDKGVPFSATKDGADQTIQILEHTGSALPWTAPVDLTVDEAVTELASDEAHGHWSISPTYFAVNYERCYRLALFANGHGKLLPQRLDSNIARKLFTAAGGETVDLDSLDYRWRRNGRTLVRFDHVYAFTAFVGLSLLPGVRLVRKSSRGEGSPAGC